MKSDLAQSREAVRRAGQSTKLLLAASVGLMVGLGSVFSYLMIRQNTLQDGIREDALWAVYQLDREGRTLSQTIDDLGPLSVPSRADLEELTLRYDILYSRLSVLENSKYNTLFEDNRKFSELRSDARTMILAMESFFNDITATRQANRNLIVPTRSKLIDLLHVTENLLTYTNSELSASRADARNEVMRLQQFSGAIVGLLLLTIGLLLLNLMRQVKAVKAAAAVLESTATQLSLAYEAAEAGNRAKSEFMATIGHEIRTPLNAILGMAELLGHATLEPDDREHVSVITASGTALLEMLNEILDFAKIEHGRMTSEQTPFDVVRLVTETARVVEGRARERRNRLDVLLDTIPDASWFLGDPTLIHRVLLNLLSNAVKFTENGIVRVRVSIATESKRLRFEVADTGIGIPSEARDRLFSAFTQVDSSISRRFGGTGLGLAICKRIVEGLGGEIGVDSAPGLGSKFWFEIPVEPAEPQERPADHSEATSSALPRLKILVVEDHPINRQVASKFLGMLGQDVTLACDGVEGVAMAAESRYDLILMDMQMPNMDGIAATNAIRASGNSVPIIAMTANASDEDKRRCSEAGMDGFESKPITLKRLTALLQGFSKDVSAAPVAVIEPEQPAQTTPWDGERIDELVLAVGEDGLRELIDMFVAEMPLLLRQVMAAAESHDAGQMDHALHAMKGAAANLGLTSIAMLAQTLRQEPAEATTHDRLAAELSRIDFSQLRPAA